MTIVNNKRHEKKISNNIGREKIMKFLNVQQIFFT